MYFYHFPKETPHNIKAALDQKERLAAKNDYIEERLLFEEDNNNIMFYLGDDEDIVLLNVSGTIMAINWSTLGMFKDTVLANQFDNTL